MPKTKFFLPFEHLRKEDNNKVSSNEQSEFSFRKSGKISFNMSVTERLRSNSQDKIQEEGRNGIKTFRVKSQERTLPEPERRPEKKSFEDYMAELEDRKLAK